jgi:hypothetical protein
MNEMLRESVGEMLLREGNAAALADLTANTFRRYRQLGLGPDYIRVSPRCIRYRREDVLRWLESRRVVPGNDGVRHTRGRAARESR